MTTMVATYPDFEQQMRTLVRQHRQSKESRLHLAVYFAPQHRAKQDIFLFEVIDGFGGDLIDPDRRLFEFGYGSTPAFPLYPDASLRMILTNPTELDHAVRENWKEIQELRAAREAGQTTVLYADAKGKKLWDIIK